jgi:hypothetical protein
MPLIYAVPDRRCPRPRHVDSLLEGLYQMSLSRRHGTGSVYR